MKNKIIGTVVYLGVNPQIGPHLSVSKITLNENQGIEGDKHSGPIRRIDAREELLLFNGLKSGSAMANLRQVTIMGKKDWCEIMNNAGLYTDSDIVLENLPPIAFEGNSNLISKFYGSSGENIVIELPEQPKQRLVSSLPVGTMIFFAKDVESLNSNDFRNASIFITQKNNPCFVPNTEVQNRIGKNGYTLGHKNFNFEALAVGYRGMCGIACTGGNVKVGDKVCIIVP